MDRSVLHPEANLKGIRRDDRGNGKSLPVSVSCFGMIPSIFKNYRRKLMSFENFEDMTMSFDCLMSFVSITNCLSSPNWVEGAISFICSRHIRNMALPNRMLVS